MHDKSYDTYFYEYILNDDCLYLKEIAISFGPSYELIPAAYRNFIHDCHHKGAKEYMTRYRNSMNKCIKIKNFTS